LNEETNPQVIWENSDLRKAWTTALENTNRATVLLRQIRELEINRYA